MKNTTDGNWQERSRLDKLSSRYIPLMDGKGNSTYCTPKRVGRSQDKGERTRDDVL